MKMSVIIEQPAFDDLENIFDYIGRESSLIAQKVLEGLFQEINSLGDFPEKYAILLTLRGYDIRQFVFKKAFRILYTIHRGEVHILHCVRCEMELTEALFE